MMLLHSCKDNHGKAVRMSNIQGSTGARDDGNGVGDSKTCKVPVRSPLPAYTMTQLFIAEKPFHTNSVKALKGVKTTRMLTMSKQEANDELRVDMKHITQDTKFSIQQ